MPGIDSMLLEIDSYTLNSNMVKDLVLEQLYRDGLLTLEQVENYSVKMQIIVVKNNWFTRWKDKYKMKDGYTYKYVKFED